MAFLVSIFTNQTIEHPVNIHILLKFIDEHYIPIIYIYIIITSHEHYPKHPKYPIDCCHCGPEDPRNSVQIHPLHLSGESVESKLRRLRDAIREQKASCILLKPVLRWGCDSCNMESCRIPIVAGFFAGKMLEYGNYPVFNIGMILGVTTISLLICVNYVRSRYWKYSLDEIVQLRWLRNPAPVEKGDKHPMI